MRSLKQYAIETTFSTMTWEEQIDCIHKLELLSKGVYHATINYLYSGATKIQGAFYVYNALISHPLKTKQYSMKYEHFIRFCNIWYEIESTITSGCIRFYNDSIEVSSRGHIFEYYEYLAHNPFHQVCTKEKFFKELYASHIDTIIIVDGKPLSEIFNAVAQP